MKADKLQISHIKKRAKGRLRAFTFKDGAFFVSYIPSLNLSSYGDTVKDANEMMHDTISDFFQSLFKLTKSQMILELEKIGWGKNKFFKKQYEHAESFIDKDGILNNFNLPKETVLKETLITV